MVRMGFAKYKIWGAGFELVDEARSAEAFLGNIMGCHLVVKAPRGLIDNYLTESCIKKILEAGGDIIIWPDKFRKKSL